MLFAEVQVFGYFCRRFSDVKPSFFRLYMQDIILTIETSTRACSAALCRGEEVLAGCYDGAEGNHARMLPLFVERLTEQLRTLHCLPSAVAVSSGPGSYTGLRIGVSTAKGLAYGWGVPLVAVPTLQVLCASFMHGHKRAKNAVLCPMLDARRMEVYTALYDTGLHALSEVEARVVTDGSFLADGEVYYFGNGAAKCQPLIESERHHFVADIEADARMMGRLAAERLAAGQTEDVAYFEPFYLKDFVAAPSHIKGLQ